MNKEITPHARINNPGNENENDDHTARVFTELNSTRLKWTELKFLSIHSFIRSFVCLLARSDKMRTDEADQSVPQFIHQC